MINDCSDNLIQADLSSWTSSGVSFSGGRYTINGQMSQALEFEYYSPNVQLTFEVYAHTRDRSNILQLTSDYGETIAFPLQSKGKTLIQLEFTQIPKVLTIQVHGSCTVGALELLADKGLSSRQLDYIQEVVKFDVISVENIHAMNAWIRNLFVEYVETNIEDLLSTSYTTTRHFIRIRDEQQEMVTQTLSATETEPMTIPDPRGGSNDVRIPVFYTAIGEHPDAHMYFTTTHPKEVHPEFTEIQIEAFRVRTKKIIREEVKWRTYFDTFTTDSGQSYYGPVQEWGAGTDSTGATSRGKGRVYKDPEGLHIEMLNSVDKLLGICLHEDRVTVKNPSAKGLHNIHIFNQPPTEEQIAQMDEYDVVLIPQNS